MNAACRVQIERLRDELDGQFIPLSDDEQAAIVCFVPAEARPGLEPDASADWERVATPVLFVCDGVQTRLLLDPHSVEIASALARGDRINVGAPSGH